MSLQCTVAYSLYYTLDTTEQLDSSPPSQFEGTWWGGEGPLSSQGYSQHSDQGQFCCTNTFLPTCRLITDCCPWRYVTMATISLPYCYYLKRVLILANFSNFVLNFVCVRDVNKTFVLVSNYVLYWILCESPKLASTIKTGKKRYSETMWTRIILLVTW